jgi:hypothetical protein
MYEDFTSDVDTTAMGCTLVLLQIIIVAQIQLIQGSNCSNYLTTKNLQLIYDYTSWKNIKSLIIFDESLRSANTSFNAY